MHNCVCVCVCVFFMESPYLLSSKVIVTHPCLSHGTFLKVVAFELGIEGWGAVRWDEEGLRVEERSRRRMLGEGIQQV